MHKKRLLIVDDSDIDRAILRNIIEGAFEVTEAENGYVALKCFTGRDRTTRFDAILLDISMPVLDGFNVLKMLRENGNNIPVVLITAEATKENVERGFQYNISGFISKPFNADIVISKMCELFNIPPDKLPKIKEMRKLALEDVEAIENYVKKLTDVYNDYLYNTNHTPDAYKRISDVMHILLEAYASSHPSEGLDEKQIDIISKAAYFFDIGRMSVADSVIMEHKMRSAYMTAYENHTRAGADIVALNQEKSCRTFVRICSEMCLHHHERFDGNGYPHKQKGDEIYYYTRLCSIAIEFDKVFIKLDDISEIQFDFVVKELGFDRGAFDPRLLKILEGCHKQIVVYYKKATNQ